MPWLPSWAPNVHPLVVHVPIALLGAAVAADAVSLFRRDLVAVRDTATWLYLGGAAAAVAAQLSGDSAARAMTLPVEALPLVATHADWAFRATWLFVSFASVRLVLTYLRPPTRIAAVAAFAVAVVGLAALVATVLAGRRLVFEHGIGVQAVAAATHTDGKGTE